MSEKRAKADVLGLTNPDIFMTQLYIDAIVGTYHTTRISQEMEEHLVNVGWCEMISSDSGDFLVWNVAFLQERSLPDLMSIYTYCKTGKLR